MIKLGLKLWSNNRHYVGPARKLYEDGFFDYIELYCVPGSYAEHISAWREVKVPFIVHAAHSEHGFNLADNAREELNVKMFAESRAFAESLNARYIIVHPGVVAGDEDPSIHDTVKRQLKLLNDMRILVENKPFLSVNRKDICAGNSPVQIIDYLKSTKLGFCLDLSHAFNYAKHKNNDYIRVVEDFARLGPKVVHMCGIRADSDVDEHLHFKDGDVDIRNVLRIIKKTRAEFYTIETPKDRTNSLDDFKEDVSFLKKIMEEITGS